MGWTDLRLGKKIAIGVGSVLFLLLLISIWSIYGLSSVVREGHEVIKGNSLRSELLQREIDHLNWIKNVGIFLIDNDVKSLGVETDHTQCGFGKWYYDKARTQAETLVPALKQPLALIEEPHRKLHESAIQIKKLYVKGDNSAAGKKLAEEIFTTETQPNLQKMQVQLAQMNEISKKNLLTEAVMMQNSLHTRLATIILSFVAIILGITIAIIITRSITKPLAKGVTFAQAVAGGDLSGRLDVNSKDEVGDLGNALNSMVENLREITREIIEGVNVLASSSSEIMASTNQVAAGATETAAAVSETTSTVEEVKQTALMASSKARSVSETAQKSVQTAQGGRKAVAETVAGMGHIQEQVEAIAASIVRLSEQSQAIGDIITTVNDLAEQSNLLAVNAAIEAAKAGEQGKGFAVVAQEVKSLAEQSKEATSQVRTILNDIQKATNAAAMATEQGNKAVEAGVKQSQEAGTAIRLMGESIEESAQAALQISASNQQQLTGMDQVALAMENIRQASEQNVTGMRQVELTVQGLHELGQKLKGLVGQYKV